MKNVTFNDLPELVSELNEKISSLESKLDVHLAASGKKNENTHVPMSREEACAYLGGITKSSFYYKVKMGGLPIVKQGKRILVYRDELDKWLESGRKGDVPMSIEDEHAILRGAARRRPDVNGNKECSDFGNKECSNFGSKTAVVSEPRVQ